MGSLMRCIGFKRNIYVIYSQLKVGFTALATRRVGKWKTNSRVSGPPTADEFLLGSGTSLPLSNVCSSSRARSPRQLINRILSLSRNVTKTQPFRSDLPMNGEKTDNFVDYVEYGDSLRPNGY